MCMNEKNVGIIFGYSNWILAEDGYIYFNQIVAPNEQIGLCKYIRIEDELIFESSKDYILNVILEASDSPYSYIAV